MIRVFYGNDRISALRMIKKILGEDYQTIEGENVELSDLPSFFNGGSLFSAQQKILIRDLSLGNSAAFSRLGDFVETKNEVILLEEKIDKRSAFYKNLSSKIDFREFKLPEKNTRAIFDVFETAKKDGKKALQLLDTIRADEDPYAFFGLLVSQALRDFKARPTASSERVLKALSRLDLEMKSSSIDKWFLIDAFLLRLSQIA